MVGKTMRMNVRMKCNGYCLDCGYSCFKYSKQNKQNNDKEVFHASNCKGKYQVRLPVREANHNRLATVPEYQYTDIPVQPITKVQEIDVVATSYVGSRHHV